MQVTIQTADGREIRPSINPAPAGLNRTLRRTRPSALGHAAGGGERAAFLARAQAVAACRPPLRG